jgi:hypothetical protein
MMTWLQSIGECLKSVLEGVTQTFLEYDPPDLTQTSQVKCDFGRACM